MASELKRERIAVNGNAVTLDHMSKMFGLPVVLDESLPKGCILIKMTDGAVQYYSHLHFGKERNCEHHKLPTAS